MKPNRAQLEIAAVATAVLVVLYLYRSYLERSLEIQRAHGAELLADRKREQAERNGHASRPSVPEMMDMLRRDGYRVDLVTPPPPIVGDAPDA